MDESGDISARRSSAGSSAAAGRRLSHEERAWLACARKMGEAGREALLPLVGQAEGREALGCGAGGDRTLQIDRAAEEAIRRALEANAPSSFTLVSEEAGVISTPGAQWRLLLDPVDGSLNAKRGLEPFSLSLAMAREVLGGGPRTISDVEIGYVEDYPRRFRYSAVRGAGPAGFDGRRSGNLGDVVEIALLEAGRPDRHHFSFGSLSLLGAVGRSRDMRVRQVGSLALALCYVAAGVADVLIAPLRTRAVDVAAGLLILRESGGDAVGLDGTDIWDQPLDLERRSPFLAWRRGVRGPELAKRARGLYEESGTDAFC